MLDMIGTRLKELRLGAKPVLTQEQCADIVGTTKQFVSQLELGKNKKPNGEFLEGWARHFRVHHRWLASGVGPKWISEKTQEKPSIEAEVDDLKCQVESLTIVLASLVGVSAKHRTVEGEELARVIRGNQSLDSVRHDLAFDMLSMLDPKVAKLAAPVVPGRKRSAS